LEYCSGRVCTPPAPLSVLPTDHFSPFACVLEVPKQICFEVSHSSITVYVFSLFSPTNFFPCISLNIGWFFLGFPYTLVPVCIVVFPPPPGKSQTNSTSVSVLLPWVAPTSNSLTRNSSLPLPFVGGYPFYLSDDFRTFYSRRSVEIRQLKPVSNPPLFSPHTGHSFTFSCLQPPPLSKICSFTI